MLSTHLLVDFFVTLFISNIYIFPKIFTGKKTSTLVWVHTHPGGCRTSTLVHWNVFGDVEYFPQLIWYFVKCIKVYCQNKKTLKVLFLYLFYSNPRNFKKGFKKSCKVKNNVRNDASLTKNYLYFFFKIIHKIKKNKINSILLKKDHSM